ncbi:MAG: recombinase family protein [Clostridia bacterium]|nr:recombinase family protein [Clostridia bacterium]
MKSKQTKIIVGIYARLSKDDERAGDSLSIENQKLMLTKYVAERGWELHDVYVDDGVSGTTFNREGVQRLIEDAKAGIINTILVKDLSRFGRNYIQVGQYLDYVFPSYNIRFIALSDNIDTAGDNTMAMDMMPITNVFNEWYASSTSRKVRSVFTSNAKMGKSNLSHAPYGYLFGNDSKRTYVIDYEVSGNVERIFDMRVKGYSPAQIADAFNEEKILTPLDYLVKKTGKYTSLKTNHYWSQLSIRKILQNPAYIGNLALHRRTTVSYKNHKVIYRPEEEWIVTENAHPAIISKELWDRVRDVEQSVSQGKKTRSGIVHPFSGLMYCADCGCKMKLGYYHLMKDGKPNGIVYSYDCGGRKRYGKTFCTSHYVKASVVEEFILEDIKRQSRGITLNEASVRDNFTARQMQIGEQKRAQIQSELNVKMERSKKLDSLIESAFEEKIEGKIPADLCVKLIEKYSTERQTLSVEINGLEEELNSFRQEEADSDSFIRKVEKYMNDVSVTRELCLELIDKIVIGNISQNGEPQEIQIYYKIAPKTTKNVQKTAKMA